MFRGVSEETLALFSGSICVCVCEGHHSHLRKVVWLSVTSPHCKVGKCDSEIINA